MPEETTAVETADSNWSRIDWMCRVLQVLPEVQSKVRALFLERLHVDSHEDAYEELLSGLEDITDKVENCGSQMPVETGAPTEAEDLGCGSPVARWDGVPPSRSYVTSLEREMVYVSEAAEERRKILEGIAGVLGLKTDTGCQDKVLSDSILSTIRRGTKELEAYRCRTKPGGGFIGVEFHLRAAAADRRDWPGDLAESDRLSGRKSACLELIAGEFGTSMAEMGGEALTALPGMVRGIIDQVNGASKACETPHSQR